MINAAKPDHRTLPCFVFLIPSGVRSAGRRGPRPGRRRRGRLHARVPSGSPFQRPQGLVDHIPESALRREEVEKAVVGHVEHHVRDLARCLGPRLRLDPHDGAVELPAHHLLLRPRGGRRQSRGRQRPRSTGTGRQRLGRRRVIAPPTHRPGHSARRNRARGALRRGLRGKAEASPSARLGCERREVARVVREHSRVARLRIASPDRLGHARSLFPFVRLPGRAGVRGSRGVRRRDRHPCASLRALDSPRPPPRGLGAR